MSQDSINEAKWVISAVAFILFQGDDGWMACKNDPELRCFGILHVPETSNPTTSGGVAGIEYLRQTIKKLSGMRLL